MKSQEVIALLSAPLKREDIKTRRGPGGKMLSYAEWHTVADRLDSVVPTWCFERSELYSDESGKWICTGRITLVLDDGVIYRDSVGYGDGDKEKGAKEAVSDCIKRCAALLGVGRELYRDELQNAEAAKANLRTISAAERVKEVLEGGTIGAERGHALEVVIAAAGRDVEKAAALFKVSSLSDLTPSQEEEVYKLLEKDGKVTREKKVGK